MENLLSIDETAQKLKSHPETVRRFIRQGQLAGVKLGRSWRVRESDLTAFIAPRVIPVRVQPSKPENTLAFALTPAETARRLAALDALGQDVPNHRAEAGMSPIDLSGERGDVYGYWEREDAQR